MTVELLSTVPLERMPSADADAWLDRTLIGQDVDAIRDAGFGTAVRAAVAQRRQWLIDQGLATEAEGAVRYRANLLTILQRRELLRVAGRFSEELDLAFAETREGERIEGILRRRVDLMSGRFALVEKAHEFTLVPWRPTLERQIGKQAGGIMREGGINWQIGRGREGPTISGSGNTRHSVPPEFATSAETEQRCCASSAELLEHIFPANREAGPSDGPSDLAYGGTRGRYH